MFEHIGEEPENIGEESRAYLTEHIVKQITQAIIQQKEKDAREANRKLSKQEGKGTKRKKLQVDQHSDGGTGSNSTDEPKADVRGTENSDGKTVGETGDSVQGTGADGVSSNGNPQ